MNDNKTSSEGARVPAVGYRTTAEEVVRGVDLRGKVAIVTGANSGIGQESARVLALRGATVVLAVRNIKGGEQAREVIRQSLARHSELATAGDQEDLGARLRVMQLDLASLASVRQFAGAFLSTNLPLNILMNNAGVMMMPFSLSADGYEMQLATNHLGPFLLTNLLLPRMKETAAECGQEGRVVNLSSSLHAKPYPKVGIRLGPLLHSPRGYDPSKSYGASKLANVLHARHLARRLQEEGAAVTVNAVHPGVIKTKLFRHVLPSGTFQGLVFNGLHAGVFSWFWKTVSEGAATQCYAAVHASVKGVSGKYFMDCRIAEDAASTLSKDEELARKLWEASEEMVGK